MNQPKDFFRSRRDQMIDLCHRYSDNNLNLAGLRFVAHESFTH